MGLRVWFRKIRTREIKQREKRKKKKRESQTGIPSPSNGPNFLDFFKDI